MTLKSTISVDIKDNKYRYSFPFGSISNRISNISSRDLSLMGGLSLDRLEKELRFFSEVSERYYQGDLTWNIDDRYNMLISEYNDKGLKDDVNTLKIIRNNYLNEITAIKNSLIKNMVVIDDF